MRGLPSILALMLVVLLAATASAQSEGDAERGKKIFGVCKSCHQLGPNAKNRIGPALIQVLDKPVGRVEGFKYSNSLRILGDAGMHWTVEALDLFLERPKDFANDTKMSFRGLKKPKDRADVIAYLASLSGEIVPDDAPETTDQPRDVAGLKGDPEKGRKAFGVCKACHAIGAGAKVRIGPPLNGMFGARVGGVEGARYSEAMKRMRSDGLVWTAETLDAYIENPKALVSGTRMNFPGLPDAKERADLLAYLRQFSDNPADIPEAEPTAIGTDHDVDPAILAIQGDPEYGEYLSNECLTCHKADGADAGIPSVTGWPLDDFVIAMHAYKKKLRPHPVMQMMAGRLSDEEIAALAAYFKDLE